MICSKCFEKLPQQIGLIRVKLHDKEFVFHTKCAPEPYKIREAQLSEDKPKP